jgi:hypothetical protein
MMTSLTDNVNIISIYKKGLSSNIRLQSCICEFQLYLPHYLRLKKKEKKLWK